MSAAGVHHLPPRRSGLRRWAARIAGLLATAALLSVGVASVLMVLRDTRGDDAALSGAPAAAPETSRAATRHRRAGHRREPRLTAAQRRERNAAAAVLRDQGYRAVDLAAYDPSHALRVLIGRGDGGQRAFFFLRGAFIAHDAADDSARIRVVRDDRRAVTLAYRLYAQGDDECCPTGGTARVRFRLEGGSLRPVTPIPPAAARRAPAA